MPSTLHPQVKRRETQYALRVATKIWDEEPSTANPYLAAHCRCHGYDLLELVRKKGFIDVVFLLFLGEIPHPHQAQLLEALMMALINPGPRHPATRAAMNAGVGKTDPAHILPIGLTVLSGTHLGAKEVEMSMRFLLDNRRNPPDEIAGNCLKSCAQSTIDCHLAPGFGQRFGGIDPLPQQLAKHLLKLPGSGEILQWSKEFVSIVEPAGFGWLTTGLAAATLCDLGLHPRNGPGLYQLFCAPGILAHGQELANKPLSAMPFLDEEHYVIADEARKK